MKTVTKNTTYLMCAFVIQKILTFLYFILITRSIGNINLGKYIFALSFAAIFSIFIDLGLNQVLVKEVAKYKEKIIIYLSNIFVFKILVSSVCFLLMILVANLLNYSLEIKILIYCAGAVTILDSLTATFYAIWRGLQNLKYEAIGIIIFQVTVFIFGAIAILLKLPLFVLILSLILGGLLNFLFVFFTLSKNAFIVPKIALFDKKIIFLLLKITIPFSLILIFSRILNYSDVVLLKNLADDKSVGLYSVASKFVVALQFIPTTFLAALYPAFSNYFVSSKKLLVSIFEKAFTYLIFISLPISVISIMLADKIILGIFGLEFVNSIIPFKILMVGLPFIFLNTTNVTFLTACNKQVINTVILGIGVVASIILNIIFIPLHSYIGVSYIATITFIAMFFMTLFWVNKIFSESIESIWKCERLIKNIGKAFFAATVIGLVTFYLKEIIFWPLLIVLSLFFYLLILFLIKGITVDEIKMSWGKIIKK